MSIARTNTHAVFVTLGANNHSTSVREQNDYYATEPLALEALLEHEQFSDRIWECACGTGHLSEVLKRHGYDVKSTDLIDRGYGEGGGKLPSVGRKVRWGHINKPAVQTSAGVRRTRPGHCWRWASRHNVLAIAIS